MGTAKKTVGSATVRVSILFWRYDDRPPVESKGRYRPSLKGKLKGHGNALRGTTVSAASVSAKLHCFKERLLAQG